MNAAGPADEEAEGTEIQEEKIATSPSSFNGGGSSNSSSSCSRGTKMILTDETDDAALPSPLSPPSASPSQQHNDQADDADGIVGGSPVPPAPAATPPAPNPPPPPRRALPRTSSSSPVATTATAAAAAHLLKKQQEHRAAAPEAIPPNRRRLRIYPTGRNRTNKWVTREIAALDFLTGLRMRNEAAILAQGTSGGGGGGMGGGGGDGASAGDAEISSLPGSSSGGGGGRTAGDHKSGGVWGWDVRKASDGGGSESSGVEAAARGVSPGAGEGGKIGAGGEAKVKDAGGRNTATGGGGGNGVNSIDDDDEDTDSETGWLDQPLPSSDRGGGDYGANGNRSAQQLRGTPARRGTESSVGVGRVSGAGVGSPAPARRLRGREAAHVRLPSTFRHRMQSLPGHSAAVVRQWEQGLTRQDRLLEGRMFFSCSKGYPIMVSSVIHYKPQEEQAKRARQKRIDERGAEAFEIPKRDWRGFSYAHLLLPCTGGDLVGDNVGLGAASSIVGSGVGGIEAGDGGTTKEGGALMPGGGSVGAGVADGGGGGDGAGGEAKKAPYKAGFLDDPALKVGRHRHMTRGDQHTGPVVSSVLLFVKPRVLKDELNARFREEHPFLPPSLTLSKIRSVKRQALLGCFRANMEVSTVALACIYFERLCLAGLVTKPNRRLTMAACLAIAYKFNEAVLEGASKLPALWAFVDQEWQVSKKRVLEAEFGVLVRLSFDLHEDPRDIFHHFVLLLKMVESNASLYLGEEMMGLHQESLETFFRDGSSDDENGGGGGGGGPDSPGGDRVVSESGTVGTDGAGRARSQSSQRSPFLETPAWLQRRPTSGSRWLAGWRAGVAAQANAAAAGAGHQPFPAQLHQPAEATAEADAEAEATGARDRWSAAAASKLAKLRRAGQGLGKETRQRGQKMNRSVRSGASSFWAHGLSSSRRRGRRRMEA
eukprot:g13791.t1